MLLEKGILVLKNFFKTNRKEKGYFSKMAAPATDYISEIVQESFSVMATDQDNLVFNKDFYKAKKEVTFPYSQQFS